MTAFGGVVITKEISPRLEAKMVAITLDATADDTNTTTVTLADHGITTFIGILGFIHTTLNSVIVQEQPTTAVSAGVLTITVGGSSDNKARTYIIVGF